MNRTSSPATRLVYAPTTDPAGQATCADLLLPSAPEDQNVLLVSLTATPDDGLAFWREQVSTVEPNRMELLCVSDRTRTSAGPATDTVDVERGRISIEVVDGPGNLTQLGVAITNTITDWETEPQQTVVCFDSITTMLQYVEVDRAFQFFNRLLRTIRDTGGIAHFHVDPGAHDETALNTLRLLFDDVIRPGEDPTTVAGGSLFSRDSVATARAAATLNGGEVFHTDIEPWEPPYRAVIRAIAAVEGVPPTDLDTPLYSWIDPDAMDALVTPRRGSSLGGALVEFTFEQYRVWVTAESIQVASL